MSNLNYYQTIYQRISRKTPESTVSIWGIRQPKLRQYLVKSLSEVGSHSGLLADPVFESTYAWESAQPKMSDLAGNLLQRSLVKAMDQAPKERFGEDWHPHKHQLKSWKTVLEDKKSIVVTSGTGSGKTECFMVPILNDLVKEAEETKQNLEGVRALFLYPLNALINSQRNRLRAWTQPYGKQVRFCLYNGETPENIKKGKKSEAGQNPNEILDRATLRQSPSPMLVTNATMLEYMLVRHNDAPILEQSVRKLRWIVLDEAHTYMGSQAAELSLLLKRVMLAFKVNPKDVRFVATSATIGDDEQAKRALTTFLSSLAGIDESQVEIIGGQRIVPSLTKEQSKPISLDELEMIEPDKKISGKRYQALKESKIALKLRDILHPRNKAKTLSEITQALWNDANKKLETLRWIDVCSATSNDDPSETPFLPLRGHFFHQTTDRLWACVDKDCSCKANDDLGEDWMYGMVYTYQRQSCECGAPVYEVVLCQDCATPYLLAEKDLNSREVKQSELERIDEFALIEEDSFDDEESDIEEQNAQSTNYQTILLCGQDYESKTDPENIGFDRSFFTKPDIKTVQTHSYIYENSCPCCEHSARKGSFYRRTFLGAPFFIANTMPILLDACSVEASQSLSDLPYDGRKLITFSDSRQGTARIAVKIQQESERAVLRTQITDETNKLVEQSKVTEEDKTKIDELNKILETNAYPAMRVSFEAELEKLTALMSGKLKINTLGWHDAVRALLANSQDVKTRILDAYRRLDSQFFNETLREKNIAELLLIREFARRPKNQNSLETLGLVSVQYPAINALTSVPEAVNRLGFDINLQDWKALLKLILDFYFRENTIATISDSQTKWMGAKIFAKKIHPFDYNEKLGKRRMYFPKAKKAGRQNRIVRVLTTAFEEKNLDFKHRLHLDWINSILKSAWKVLLSASHEHKNARYQLLIGDKNEGFQLNMEAISFSANKDIWACPYTNRLIDSTFKGISPYLPNGALKAEATCDLIEMPESVLKMDTKDKTDNFSILATDANIQKLRDRNLWTDMNDRVFEYSRFIRSEEHSAQQSSKKLKQYEELFEEGKINVLNCSTTMEMGVDIGGISVVEMNNVPPHPANYLQRAGRAGRRKETQSLAFTMCKNNTHEKTVFHNPKWAFETLIKAPYVKLDSNKIVQRHISSYLLAYFLKYEIQDQEKQATSLTCHWFYTHLADGKEPYIKEPYIRFNLWLAKLILNMDKEIDCGISSIKQQTGLISAPNPSLIQKTISQLEVIAKKWILSFKKVFDEYEKLTPNQQEEPYGKKLYFDLKTFEKEYLLSHLATSAFLPGYGFPTGLVSFDQMTISDFNFQKEANDDEREDRYSRRRERPTRNLAIAIREYAPGAQVVLDGLVYQSEGVLLNVNEPESGFTEPQRFEAAWRCNHCGQIGYEKTYQSKICCTNCGHDINLRDIQEYLTPEAFSVGFYGEPTNDITSQTYLPVESEWVSADNPPQTLFNPSVGSYRVSDQGNIFYHSRGQHQKGYAVCLRCGRAESMSENDELPKVFSDSGHKRLRGIVGQDSWCDGTIENFAVKTNVAFGGTLQTDVFELYLKHPETSNYFRQGHDEKLAWTLAATLREALAEIHGIDASEMGFLVKPIDLEDSNGKSLAIVLYDKNGGGSGFASTGYKNLEDMFEKSLIQLDCPVHCDMACQSCLIDFETRHQEKNLDRKVALAYLEKIRPYLTLNENDQILGPNTEYCHDSLDSELLYLGYQGDCELLIYLGGKPSDWSIAESGLKGQLQAFHSLYKKVILVLPEIDFSELAAENQQDLYFFHLSGITLSKGSAHKDNAHLLADVVKGNNIQRFASNKPINYPNESFWRFSDAVCVKAEANQTLEFNTFDVTQFIGKVDDTVKDIEIREELNGSLPKFGERFWTHIIQSSDSFLKTFQTKKLAKITYEDKYINSPWIVLVIHNFLDALKKAMGSRWAVDSIELSSSKIFNPPKGWLLARDFESSKEKESFIHRYLSDLTNKITVNIEDVHTIKHARVLTLSWEDGTVTRIRLDHGFGNWKWDGRIDVYLEVSKGWIKQIDAIKKIEKQTELNIINNGQHATYIVVRNY